MKGVLSKMVPSSLQEPEFLFPGGYGHGRKHALGAWAGKRPLLREEAPLGIRFGWLQSQHRKGGLMSMGKLFFMAGAALFSIFTASAANAQLSTTGNQLWHQNSGGIEGSAGVSDYFGKALATGDFNGDGRADLAVGVPGETVSRHPGAGVVNVIYGSASGLSPTGDQLWNQNTSGVLDTAEDGDGFGQSLASGDFNGDGYADLAIGVPGESVGGHLRAGAVNVLYGSASGLTATGDQLWHQNSVGILNTAGAGNEFGSALATGDFNGDGYADLAIGVPGEAVGGHPGAGAVNVIYGSSSGLRSRGNQFWDQDRACVGDTWCKAEGFDKFGSVLASGDFNGDGYADLAIGVPMDDVIPWEDSKFANAGSVNVLYGSASGLSATDYQHWIQFDLDPLSYWGVEKGDGFGQSLASGDFNGDGYADLAIGVPWEDVGPTVNAGMVNVLFGTASGLSMLDPRQQVFCQETIDIEGACEQGDEFGVALTSGDFNGDGYADLAIGVRSEAIGTVALAGAVNVLYGSASKLTSAGDQLWHQNSSGVLDTAESSDFFGSALAAGDFNGDGAADLAIGVPLERIGTVSGAGAVNVLYGSD
jgi:hypothetical protein